MLTFSSLVAVYNVVAHAHHDDVETGYAYMKIRAKPYPWECSDCNIFSMDCWKECRGEATESSHH